MLGAVLSLWLGPCPPPLLMLLSLCSVPGGHSGTSAGSSLTRSSTGGDRAEGASSPASVCPEDAHLQTGARARAGLWSGRAYALAAILTPTSALQRRLPQPALDAGCGAAGQPLDADRAVSACDPPRARYGHTGPRRVLSAFSSRDISHNRLATLQEGIFANLFNLSEM